MKPLTIFLQQHTPLIHFQHGQEGATLRATEVKAKLDKFIYTKGGEILQQQLFQEIKEAFNPKKKAGGIYKLAISNPGQNQLVLIAANIDPEQEEAIKRHGRFSYLKEAPFFAIESEMKQLFDFTGNLIYRNEKERARDKQRREKKVIDGDWQSVISKWGVFSLTPIKLTVKSFNRKILEAIENIVPYFFAYENFGTRQSKGFGCFSVLNPKQGLHVEDYLSRVYQFKYKCGTLFNDAIWQQKFQKQFSRIQKDYRVMKSGFNHPFNDRAYEKSRLFYYGVDDYDGIDVRWEKRKVKQQINENPLVDNRGRDLKLKSKRDRSPAYDDSLQGAWIDQDEYDYRFIRAMLGLTEQYEFQSQSNDDNRKDGPKYKVKVTHSGEIERYRSPITFKIYGNRIYLLANNPSTEIQDALYGTDFKFTLGLEKSNQTRELEDIPTPQDFDLGNFLEFVFASGPRHARINGYTNF